MLARRTPFAVDTAAPALGAPGVPGAGAGAAAAPKSVVSKSMTSATLASDAPPAVACTRLSGGAPLGVAVACAMLERNHNYHQFYHQDAARDCLHQGERRHAHSIRLRNSQHR